MPRDDLLDLQRADVLAAADDQVLAPPGDGQVARPRRGCPGRPSRTSRRRGTWPRCARRRSGSRTTWSGVRQVTSPAVPSGTGSPSGSRSTTSPPGMGWPTVVRRLATGSVVLVTVMTPPSVLPYTVVTAHPNVSSVCSAVSGVSGAPALVMTRTALKSRRPDPGILQHPHQLGGDGRGVRGPFRFQQAQRGRRVPVLQQHRPGPAQQRREHREQVSGRPGVGGRDRRRDVPGTHPDRLGVVAEQERQVVVGPLRHLRRVRRARGDGDEPRVVRVARPSPGPTAARLPGRSSAPRRSRSPRPARRCRPRGGAGAGHPASRSPWPGSRSARWRAAGPARSPRDRRSRLSISVRRQCVDSGTKTRSARLHAKWASASDDPVPGLDGHHRARRDLAGDEPAGERRAALGEFRVRQPLVLVGHGQRAGRAPDVPVQQVKQGLGPPEPLLVVGPGSTPASLRGSALAFPPGAAAPGADGQRP